jgi:hypothetical protein
MPNPKAEIRDPKEGRNPKAEIRRLNRARVKSGAREMRFLLRLGTAALRLPPILVRWLPTSQFGLRISVFGFPSDFGFRFSDFCPPLS